MEAHELAEKFRNNTKTEASYLEVVKWCGENADKLDLKDKEQQYLYEKATGYLMKYKIGKWNKEDANTVINYLAKKSAKQLGIDENVTVKILEEEEYKKTHGETSEAVCLSNDDDTFNIAYSPVVVNNLLSNDYNRFLRGMQTVFHEVVHAQQNSIIQKESINGLEIPKTKVGYIMALETITRKQDTKFYKENYSYLLKENRAEKVGLKQAMRTMQQYNPKLYQVYNQEIVEKQLAKYDQNFYDATITLENGKKYELLRDMDTLSSIYIGEHPEIIEKFPILQVGYNYDGTKKDIRQLILDRNHMLENSKTPEKVDELYEAIANHRNVLSGGLKGTKDEIYALEDYINETATDDEFVYELLKYRLDKTALTPEKIEQYINAKREKSAKVRQERDEQERVQEREDSIKDEVGEEFQPETETEKQEEQQVKAMLQNFQSWDKDAVKLPNSAKRKEEAIKVIQDIEKQKEQQDKKQNQEEQEEKKDR